MRKHGLSASDVDPANGLRQRRPLMRHVSRLAADEVTPENIARVSCVSGLDQEPGKMRAADEPRAGDELHRTVVGTGYPGRGELFSHALGAKRTAVADGLQTVLQRDAVRIDAERHDVQGDIAPAH